MRLSFLDAGNNCLPVLREQIRSIGMPTPHGKIAVIDDRQTFLPKHFRKARVPEGLRSFLLSRGVRSKTGGNSDISDCLAHNNLSLSLSLSLSAIRAAPDNRHICSLQVTQRFSSESSHCPTVYSPHQLAAICSWLFRARYCLAFARFPQTAMSHHRRDRFFDWSTNFQPQSGAAHV